MVCVCKIWGGKYVVKERNPKERVAGDKFRGGDGGRTADFKIAQ